MGEGHGDHLPTLPTGCLSSVGSEQRAGIAHSRAATALPAWTLAGSQSHLGWLSMQLTGPPAVLGGWEHSRLSRYMHTGAQGLGPWEAPEEHLRVKGLKVGQALRSFAQKSPGAQGICMSQGRNRVRF